MKLEVYNENVLKNEPVRLRLRQQGSMVLLDVVNESGLLVENGCLLEILPDGTFYRAYGVSKEIGLTLDETGRIKESF